MKFSIAGSDGERDFLTTAHNDVLQAPPPIAWIPMRGDARVAKPVEEHQQTLAKSFPDTATRVWWIERRAVLPGIDRYLHLLFNSIFIFYKKKNLSHSKSIKFCALYLQKKNQ